MLVAGGVAAHDDHVHRRLAPHVERGDRPPVGAGDGEDQLARPARGERRVRHDQRVAVRGRGQAQRRRLGPRGGARGGGGSGTGGPAGRSGTGSATDQAGTPATAPTFQAAPKASASAAEVAHQPQRRPHAHLLVARRGTTREAAFGVDLRIGCAPEHPDWRSGRSASDPRWMSTATSPFVPPSVRRRMPAGPPLTGPPLADVDSLPERDPYRLPWPGHVETSGGVTLHVRETPGPDGVPAVYVHGLSGSATNWTDLAALLSTRAAGTAVDLPGFGLSHPLASRDYTPAGHADALLCFLAGRGRPVHLLGNSLGGLVALQRRRPPSRAGAHAHPGVAGNARPQAGSAAGVGPADAAGHGAPDRRTGPGRAGRDERAGPGRAGDRGCASATRAASRSTGSPRPSPRSRPGPGWSGRARR